MLAFHPLDLDLFHLGRNGTHHARRHLVLQVEDVLEQSVETVRPQMAACGGIDQLAGNTHTATRLPDTALENLAHTQLTPDLLDVDGTALLGEAGITRDHEKGVEARQACDDVFHHAISKILQLRIATHVLEGQNRNRGLVG